MPDSSVASREAGLTLSSGKLQKLRPWFFGWRGVLTAISNFIGPPLSGTLGSIRTHVQRGDSNAAILLEVSPPLVAAYSEDLDSVPLLTFTPDSVDAPGLKPGTRLIAVCTYRPNGPAEDDIVLGPGADGSWVDFTPIIGDFVSDDRARLDQLRALIPAAHWTQCAELAKRCRQANPGKARDGRPGYGGLRNLFTQPAQSPP